MTPITVQFLPPIVTVWPMIARLPAKRRCHRSCPRITTGSVPGVSRRERTRDPTRLNASTGKKSAETFWDLDFLRLAATRQVEACVPTGGDFRKMSCIVFPIEKVRRRNGILGAVPREDFVPTP